MPFLEFFDETLDINSTENYELSVELSPDNLSFCILDTIRNKFIMLRSSQPESDKKYSADELGEMIRKDDFLTRKYKKVNVVTPSPKFTLVPMLLFDPGRKDEYFMFNHILEDKHIILVNKLIEPDSFLVYSQPKAMNDQVKNAWPGVNPLHHLKPFFEHLTNSVKSTSDHLHIHVERDFFNLILYSNNTLKFCNSFTYKSISDILYYTLNMFKSLGVRQEGTIFLSGLVGRKNDLYSGLVVYVRNIKFSEPSGNFTYSYVLNETDLFRYINLISVVNCG
jgi:hypothetical protein